MAMRLKFSLLCLILLLFQLQAEGQLAESGFVCPVCQIEFASLTLAGPQKYNESIAGGKMDFRPPPLPECPLCGLIIEEGGFSETELKKLPELVWSSDFQQHRHAAGWLRRAILKEKLGHETFELVQAWLDLAAVAGNDANLHRSALERSAALLENYLLINEKKVENAAEIRIRIADIYRQLGDFTQARNYLNRISPRANADLQRIIKLEQKMIETKHTSAVAVPDGNELHLAIKNNEMDLCRSLAQRSDLIEERDRLGRTPLQLAVELRRSEPVAILLKAGAKAESKNAQGLSPVQLAVKTAAVEILALLLRGGADIYARDSGGNNLLHLACAGIEGERESIARMLISRNIDSNQRNFADLTPLHVAVVSGSEAMVRLLTISGAKIDSRLPDGGTALFICRNDLIGLLVELGADLEVTDNLGRTAFVAALLRQDSDRISAFKNTQKFGLNLYSDEGKDLHELFTAVTQGKVDVAETILQKKPELINQRELGLGETALHRAVLGEDMAMIDFLLQKGASTTHANHFGRTVLHYAAMGGNLRHVVRLIEAGSDVFALDVRGSTPLHEAAAADAADVYQYLINLGASDSTRNNAGKSAAELLRH